ncbi:MAG: metal-dependent hydrolase [Bacteroidota bacterium]
MTAPTHITFAEFIYLLLLTTTGVTLSVLNALVIGIASILPDVDTEASYVGKSVPFLSKRIERKFGHRTLTHSAPFVAALSILSLPLFAISPDIFVCFLIGYASHPFLDTMTVQGVKLFYPFSPVKCVFPLEVNNPHSYRLQTGSKMDKLLALLFFLGCIPTFFIAHQGYERFIRTTQQSIEAAVRDYNEFSKDHLVFANVHAFYMLTRQPLSGTIQIVGALNPHTLVFKGMDGNLHTLGKDFQADYVAQGVVCIKGDAARSSVRNVDMSNQLVSQITAFVDTSLEQYFFGDLTTTDKVSLPENIQLFSPITGSGGAIKFNYATYSDIRSFNLEYVFISKGILTVKSILSGMPGSTTDSLPVSLPKIDNFTQSSFTLDSRESIVFLKHRGDTLREKELIAKKTLAQFFQDQISLNEDKITAIEQENAATISDIVQTVTVAEQALAIDSLEFDHLLELSKDGFVPSSALQTSRLKIQKSTRLFSQLISSKSTLVSKSALDVRKLRIANQQLAAKARAAELQSEIRSTVNGILADIRQIQRNGKTQVTLLIKRLP